VDGTGELVRRWQRGWTAARGLPTTEPDGDGLTAYVGRPERQWEIVALRADEDPDSLARLAVRVAAAESTTWLTVATTQPLRAMAIVEAAGLMPVDRPEWLMTTTLAGHPRGTLPDGYTERFVREGAVITGTIRDGSGGPAAQGRMAVVGTDAVADQIMTAPTHRRRGLGSALMGGLAHAAAALGARTGLLVTSADGQRLYSALGWQRRADVRIFQAVRSGD
jgi:GNAT superfamily N-acetyltransferase